MTEHSTEIRKVRACVAALRGDLLNPSPEGLRARLPALAEATKGFSGLAPFQLASIRHSAPSTTMGSHGTHRSPADKVGTGLAGLEAQDLADLRALALELGACRKLIEHGLTTTQVLAGILAGANAGYSSTGSPSPLAAQSKVSVQA